EGFMLYTKGEVKLPIAGSVRIGGKLSKGITTDDVTVQILRLNDDDTKTIEKEYELAWNEVVEQEDFYIETTGSAGDTYYLSMESSTNINWSKISWEAFLTYQESHDPSVTTAQIAGLITPVIVKKQIYSGTLEIVEPWVADKTGTATIVPDIDFEELNSVDGEVVFTVKRKDELVQKEILMVEDGQLSSSWEFTINVEEAEELFFEFHIQSPLLVAHYKGAGASVDFDGKDEKASVGVYSGRSGNFGPMYRNWGQFSYNSNGNRGVIPIIEDLLIPSEDLENNEGIDASKIKDGDELGEMDLYDPSKEIFIIMASFPDKGLWQGYDPGIWVRAETMGSARYGLDHIETGEGDFSTGADIRAVKRITLGTGKSLSGGAGLPLPLDPGITLSKSWSSSKVLLDFIDLNGDRYPDIVFPGKVQYTLPNGGLSSGVTSLGGSGFKVHETKSITKGIAASGSYLVSSTEENPKRGKNTHVGNADVSAGISGDYAVGEDAVGYSWLDVNGDGLADRVAIDEEAGTMVALNLGYGFTSWEAWDFDQIQAGSSKSASGGASVNINQGSIVFGVGLSKSSNTIDDYLQDVTGDGLPDIVSQRKGAVLMVGINLGNGFSEMIPWKGVEKVNGNSQTGESANFSTTAGVPLVGTKVVLTPHFNTGHGISREEMRLTDMDGDGHPDYVSSDSDDQLTVRRSTIGRTNMLKSIHRPLGATITMDYKPVGNTYEHPNTVWALSKVEVNDGLTGDGVDVLSSTYEFEGGYYDRRERDFYGFATVVSTSLNEGQPYVRSVQEFVNDDYYTKGLLKTAHSEDAEGNRYSAQENTYEVRDLGDGRKFPILVSTEQQIYEGQSSPGLTTRSRYEYDDLGNMTFIHDEGGEGSDDDLEAIVTYHRYEGPYIMGSPKSIEVKGNGTDYRRREATIDPTTGQVTQIRQYLEGDQGASVHDLTYDVYGNLKTL
ncbi:MAG: hypothetical protein OEW75_15840, partial [Cyclobacteriaceae bacterium]|nr:hypothetical protein [Cyclobacteriaceae bacterium]